MMRASLAGWDGRGQGNYDSGARRRIMQFTMLRYGFEDRTPRPIIQVVAKKILVVEDTKSIREIVAFMLRSKGYETLESGDGQAAEARVRAHPPDLILLAATL